jgi:hypothetical protein
MPTIQIDPDWSAQFWVDDDGKRYTIFVNEKKNEYRRYAGALGLKALEGPPSNTPYEIPDKDGKWIPHV